MEEGRVHCRLPSQKTGQFYREGRRVRTELRLVKKPQSLTSAGRGQCFGILGVAEGPCFCLCSHNIIKWSCFGSSCHGLNITLPTGVLRHCLHSITEASMSDLFLDIGLLFNF